MFLIHRDNVVGPLLGTFAIKLYFYQNGRSLSCVYFPGMNSASERNRLARRSALISIRLPDCGPIAGNHPEPSSAERASQRPAGRAVDPDRESAGFAASFPRGTDLRCRGGTRHGETGRRGRPAAAIPMPRRPATSRWNGGSAGRNPVAGGLRMRGDRGQENPTGRAR